MPGLECVRNDVERVPLPSGSIVEVQRCFIDLEPWKGKPIQDSYGGKAVVDFRGEPFFAELAVLGRLKEDGWEGVWVDTYRGKFRTGLPEKADSCELPDASRQLYERITEASGTKKGFWDLFVWQDDEYMFVEVKRSKKDRLGPAQFKWLDAALSCGIPLQSFLIVEWDLKP